MALVDLLYEPLNVAFFASLADQEAGRARPSLVTGLLAARDLPASPARTRVVIWSAGEADRRLHLVYAYEELRMRVFCSKSPGGAGLSTLLAAIHAAAAGTSFTDPVLAPCLPARTDHSIGDTIMREPSRRPVWRALAAGMRSVEQISAETRYSKKTIRNMTSAMADDLSALDPGLRKDSRHLPQLAIYAARHREFFLDQVVGDRWP